MERFVEEQSVALEVRSEHLVASFDASCVEKQQEEDQLAWLAMYLAPCGTVRDLLTRARPALDDIESEEGRSSPTIMPHESQLAHARKALETVILDVTSGTVRPPAHALVHACCSSAGVRAVCDGSGTALHARAAASTPANVV